MHRAPRPTAGAPREGGLPTLRGSRVHLRHLTTDDVDDLHAIFSDPEVARFLAIRCQTSREMTEEFLAGIHEGFHTRTLFQWGIESGGRIVGTTTLGGLDWDNRRAEIGFALARTAWGRGLMLDALAAVLDHAFGELGLHRIEADVDPRNAPSLRVLEKLGFRREGYLRERYIKDGDIQDSVIFGLLRGDRPV